MAEKKQMTQEDAARIQSSTDQKQSQGQGPGDGFKERAQSAADRQASHPAGDRNADMGNGKSGTTAG